MDTHCFGALSLHRVLGGILSSLSALWDRELRDRSPNVLQYNFITTGAEKSTFYSGDPQLRLEIIGYAVKLGLK